MPIRQSACIFFLFFFAFRAFSQEVKPLLPLKKILQDIEIRHEVSFNYIEDEIVVYSLAPPNQEWTLDAKIDYIKTNTRLQFKAIGNSSYTLFNDKRMDKPLCGFLLDAQTGMPIENASLVIINTSYTALSDERGFFQLPVVSPNPIVIKHLNYDPFTIAPEDLYKTECPKIKLQSKIFSVEEVITQRYLTTGISKKTDGAFEVDPKKFGILAGLTEPDVLQTMQQIPGIYSTDEIISNISVRGGTHDQNMFLWNGIRMFQTGHFFGLISAFNPQLANTISISKNGTSAFFDESVSSTVAISTHSDQIEKSNYAFGVNLIDANAYAKVKTSRKASFEVSARRSYTDAVTTPTYSKYSQRIFQNTIVTNVNSNEVVDYKASTAFFFYDLSAQYQQKIGNRSELIVDGIVFSNDLGVHQQAVLNTGVNTKYSTLGQQSLGADIGWKTKWNANDYTKINAYVSNYKLSATNESVENSQILNQENTVLDTGIRLDNYLRLAHNFGINAGYQYNEIGVTNFDAINTPAFRRNKKEVLRTHAVIVESIYSDGGKVSMMGGMRLNYFENFKFFLFEPRFRFSYAVTSKLKAELLYEQKSQTASQVIDLQRDFLGIEKRRWVLTDNDSIPIQKSKQLSAGFSYKDRKWLVTFDNFYKTVGGISSSGQAFQNQLENVKANGTYTITGSEILVQHDFGPFYGWVSYSYNQSN